jgi:hypothetical protein
MKKKYISFREYHKKCIKKGTIIEVPCLWCRRTMLICKKHNTFCNSGACRKERGVINADN